MPLSQAKLEEKLNLFLQALGDENLSKFSDGLCNAFAFLNFRAHVIDQEDKNLKRMEKIMERDQKEIDQMAKIYQEYKNERRLLIEENKHSEDIQSLNQEISTLQQKLTELRENSKDEKKEIESKNIELTEQVIREKRSQREKLIEKALTTKFNEEQWAQINEAKNLYLYIHTLVAAFNPGGNMCFYINNKYVNQHNFIEILKLLPPDKLLDNDFKIPNDAFQIAFNFTKSELIELFNNTDIIHNGDLIRLTSSDHAIFLSFKDGKFKLYDPDPIEFKSNDSEELVDAIQQRFFTRRKIRSDYMPIGIFIFGNSNEPRPDRVEIINKIMKKTTNINFDRIAWDNTSTAWMAADSGHADVIKILLEAKANLNIPDDDGCTPLWIAAQNNQTEVLGILIATKVDLNTPNNEGSTPLWVAASNGLTEATKMLIESKANLNKPDNDGCTPLWVATKYNHHHIIKILSEAKAELNRGNNLNETPAILAASLGSSLSIKSLFEQKADLNKRDSKGQTPLHWAIRQANYSTIITLLECNVMPNLKDSSKLTPIDYTTEKTRSFFILQLLKRYIETHSWENKSPPPLALKQLELIKKLKIDAIDDWFSALEAVCTIAQSDQKISLFSHTNKEPESLQYLSWFSSSTENLAKNLIKALSQDIRGNEPTTSCIIA